MNTSSPIQIPSEPQIVVCDDFEGGPDTAVPLSAYPEDFVEALNDIFGGAEDELEALNRMPAECPQAISREWHHRSVVLVNGRIAKSHVIGTVDCLAVGVDPLGGYLAFGTQDGDYSAVGEVIDWIVTNCRNGYSIWWSRRDTGDGILLDSYDVLAAFQSEADEAAFLSNRGAGA
ncbi:MAG: hypothetical protein A3H25_11955 [Sphingomonadales bacterium RIFCSPLOWO2_12_FULL_63_15]|jgi:hypothetical protein|nr:MAG: hypothetical protein A3H25_11955 [Sphingomonadales bacterium RIFCSPLOWO2_12_FULL_63_15]